MIAHLAYLALGLFLLVKGSDFFVESSSNVAKKMGVSEFIIGLTLVAVGTSVPELASSVVASNSGYNELILGNVVGSNIANIGLVLGLAISLTKVKTKKDVLRRDGLLMFAATLLFYVLSFDGFISFSEGVLFLLTYLAYVLFLTKAKNALKPYDFDSFVSYFLGLEYLTTIKDHALEQVMQKRDFTSLSESRQKLYVSFREGLVKDGLVITMSLLAIVYGAGYLVEEAVWFADYLGMPQTLVGISLIAIGTSLPELGVSISAAKKGFGNMTIGNVIGSNITNLLLVLGVSSLIHPVEIDRNTLFYSGPAMILISLALLYFITSGKEMTRKKGAMLLGSYLAFMAAMFAFLG